MVLSFGWPFKSVMVSRSPCSVAEMFIASWMVSGTADGCILCFDFRNILPASVSLYSLNFDTLIS